MGKTFSQWRGSEVSELPILEGIDGSSIMDASEAVEKKESEPLPKSQETVSTYSPWPGTRSVDWRTVICKDEISQQFFLVRWPMLTFCTFER